LGEIGAITAAYLMSRVIPDIGPVRRRALPLARDDILPAILPARVVLLSRKTSHDGENDASTGQPGMPGCGGKTPKIKTNKSRGRDAMRGLIGCLALALSCAAGGSARAEISDNVVRIGVLNDISGIFQDTNGMGSVEAARMAAEDFDGGGKNIKVEIVYADHQNKADVGSAIVRKWLDVDKVDAVVDVPNSAVGLTVNALLRDTRMTFLASSTASSDLTGKACSPNTIQWVNDAWATGNTTAAAMMKRGGMDWYFITVNYALGQGIEAEATSYIEKHGGKVLGSAKHPLNTPDFASLLLQAQNSRAKVIGLANAGGDTINAVKQAGEFGIKEGGQTLVAFLLFINDVHGMGLKVAQGLQLLEAFYWDMNDDTRAFAKRFSARPGMNGKMPSGNQAGVYASTLAYLNAAAVTGSDDARDVVPQMKKFKGKDKLFGDVTIRQDGRVIHPMYLFEVKKPEESKYPYDYYKLVSTTSADQAFRPIADGGCSLVK
jgi:branched-chain amino acid transport system substrate-binding protein